MIFFLHESKVSIFTNSFFNRKSTIAQVLDKVRVFGA